MSLPSTFVKDFHDEESVRKMEYVQLGFTGLHISKISLGGGVFSQFYGYKTQLLQEFIKILNISDNVMKKNHLKLYGIH